MRPIHIFIGGTEVVGYTNFTCTRNKADLTGSFSLQLFAGHVPSAPVMPVIARNAKVLIYVGGFIAFTGKLDSRSATGDAMSYKVTLSGRGKTKRLIDSSHQHKTTNIISPTTQDAISTLISPFSIGMDFLGTAIKLDKLRFRDGARVLTELVRIGTENAHFIYETRDGKLRVTDDVGPDTGEALVLGDNILSFSTTQSSEKSRSEIKVKGQRTKKEIWGAKALLKTIKTINDSWVGEFAPITIHHYGDATPEALQRRAKFEADKRSSESKKVTVDVFHVQSRIGAPWDIGTLHYVEIASEGIFDAFECTKVTYTVDAKGTLKTTLELSPPPSGGIAGGVGALGSLLSDTGSAVSFVQRVANIARVGNNRRYVAANASDYPSPWVGPQLALQTVETVVAAAETLLTSDNTPVATPPATLPANYIGADE